MQETGVVVLVRDVRDSRGVALSWRGTVLAWWCGKCLTAYLAWSGGGVLSLEAWHLRYWVASPGRVLMASRKFRVVLVHAFFFFF
jgi:hypothetical protein